VRIITAFDDEFDDDIDNRFGNEFWATKQQSNLSETHGLGRAVSGTANQVGISAYNSSGKKDNDQGEQESKARFVISKEMIILMGIAVCKIILWCLYRSARDEGLDVTNL
jgi:hypothetical protein